jgi:hypothetical protein
LAKLSIPLTKTPYNNMKKITLLGAAAMAALFLTSHASAQPVAVPADPTIGVQFPPYYGQIYDELNTQNVNGNSNQYGYQAGVVNQQYWNVANNSTGGGNGTVPAPLDNTSLTMTVSGTTTPAASVLLDSNGNATSVLFQLSGSTGLDHTAVNTGQDPSAFGGGNIWYAQSGSTPGYLVSGIQYSTSTNVSPVTLTFETLKDTDYYNLYAYVGSTWWTGSQLVSVNLGNTTYYLTTDNGTLTNYTQGTATSAGSATMADYVEFTNIKGSLIDQDITGDALTVSGANGAAVGLSGFQLQDIGSTPAAVPEPSTVWMFSLGFLGLMFHVYRRRNAQA